MYIGNGMIVHAANPGTGVPSPVSTRCRSSAPSALADHRRRRAPVHPLAGPRPARAGRPARPGGRRVVGAGADDSVRRAARSTTTQPAPGGALAARTLERLTAAVDAGDAAGAAALAPEGDAEAARLLRARRRATRPTCGVEDFALRYVDEAGARLGSRRTWAAAVETTWRFAGFDRAPPAPRSASVSVAGTAAVAIVDVGGGDLPTPLWLTGPLDVRRTADTCSSIDRPGGGRPYARLARRAVPVVLRVLPEWRPAWSWRCPASAGGLDGAAGRRSGRVRRHRRGHHEPSTARPGRGSAGARVRQPARSSASLRGRRAPRW